MKFFTFSLTLLAFLFFLSGCRTNSHITRNYDNPKYFSDLIWTLELSRNNQSNPPLFKTPYDGIDFKIESIKESKGYFTSYRFLDIPCINETMVHDSFSKLGYSKPEGRPPPHGPRLHEPPDALRFAIAESYERKGKNVNEYFSISYSFYSDKKCVSSIVM